MGFTISCDSVDLKLLLKLNFILIHPQFINIYVGTKKKSSTKNAQKDKLEAGHLSIVVESLELDLRLEMLPKHDVLVQHRRRGSLHHRRTRHDCWNDQAKPLGNPFDSSDKIFNITILIHCNGLDL